MRTCPKCNQEKPDNYFTSSHLYCKACNAKYQRDRRKTKGNEVRAYDRNRAKKVKQKYVKYKGGKCSACGYDRCLAALEFHHIDPNKKGFTITSSGKNNIKSKPWQEIKEELDKCIMVCANCHREIHQWK